MGAAGGYRWKPMDIGGYRCIQVDNGAYQWMPLDTSEKWWNGCLSMHSLFLWWESTIESFGKKYMHSYALFHYYPLLSTTIHYYPLVCTPLINSLSLSLRMVDSSG
jgi:hypothetical protein